MPFTLAHPIAAVPIRPLMGKVGVLSALVVGSLTPDLPYFLPLGVHRISSHSPAALFWFCLPAGLAGYLLFHSLLRPVLSFLFPPGLRSKPPVLAPGSWLPAAPLAGVLVSLLVGAVTHDVWDFEIGSSRIVDPRPQDPSARSDANLVCRTIRGKRND